jgi:signal transduction histidine kinase
MSPAEINEFVEAAMQGIDRLSGEIDDILGYIGASALADNGETVTVAAFRQQVADIAAEMEMAQIVFAFAPTLLDTVLPFSVKAVNSILWEILENSKKFHPSHTPQVTVEVLAPTAGRCRLRFTDDGLTLNPEQMQWAWTPYVQAEKYFTGEAQGMGLGLPLVATLVWRVGGQVQLANRTDGPGVVVELDLPLGTTLAFPVLT